MSDAEVADLRLAADQAMLIGANVPLDPRQLHWLLDQLTRADDLEIECSALERRLAEVSWDDDWSDA